MSYLRLTIEPIPATSRLASLAQLLPRIQWDRLRRRIYQSAGYRCRICGRDNRLHCHEIWQYNQETGTQWLRGFQALCRECHDVKHILFVHDAGHRARLLEHFCTVNRVNRDQAEEHLRAAQQRQARLNQRAWTINFGSYNGHMPPLVTIRQRRNYIHARSA